MIETLEEDFLLYFKYSDHKNHLDNALSLSNTYQRCNSLISIICDVIKSSTLSISGKGYVHYDGKIYCTIDSDALNSFLYIFLCNLGIEPIDVVKILPHIFLQIRSRRINITDNLIAFKNCVLNLDNMKTFPFSSELKVGYMVDYAYEEEAECKLWQKFLNRVLPDKTKRDVLQEFVGLIFLDRSKVCVEKALFLLGGGANGKSVIAKTIKGIVGHEAVSTFTPQQLVASEYAIAGTYGKRLNYCEEVDSRGCIPDKMKAIISGEPIQARNPYGSYITVHPPVMMFNLNELPAMPDKTYGFWRRQIIIEFDVTIPESERDKTLAVKLQGEYPGIFQWALRGLSRLKRNNYEFSCSDSIDDTIKYAQIINNPVMAFMEANRYAPKMQDYECQENYVPASELSERFFHDWMGRDGKIPKTELVRFGLELSKLGYEKIKRSTIQYKIYKQK